MEYSCAILSLKKASGVGTAQQIWREAKNHFSKVEFYTLNDVKIGAGNGMEVYCNGKSLRDFDCVYLRGPYSRVKLLTSIAISLQGHCYMPVQPEAFMLAHDKFLTLLQLKKAGLEIPLSYLVYTQEATKKILKRMHYPIVFKLPEGTHGKGVLFADSEESAISMTDMLAKVKSFPILLQEFVGAGGHDIRALVIGRKVWAIKRKAVVGEHRANIHAGAGAEPIALDSDTKHTAIKAARALGMDIAAVDILESGKKRLVVEVNVSPGLLGISKALKRPLAQEVAAFLAEQTKSFKEKEKEQHFEALKEDLEPTKELVTNLDIKGEQIRLPSVVTKTSKIIPTDEVSIKVGEGTIIIKKVKE